MPFALRYAARSNVGLGSKNRNEDSGYASPTMLILADGMGGHAAGDIASSTVVGMVSPLDGDDIGSDDALDQLSETIAAANDRLRSEMDADPAREGMGTTLIVLMKAGGRQLAMANIGDSRAYQLRDGKFTQITKDHSFVQSLLDAGRISPEEAVHHPQRSLVTRVLTGREGDAPDLSLREAKIGDRFLLCSDGLSDYVNGRTIEEIFSSGAAVDVVADELIDIALKASTLDNVTVVVAEVIESDQMPANSTPQVVGAAMDHGTTQAVPTRDLTPAEKARQLSQEVTPQSTDDEDDLPDDETDEIVLAEETPRRSRRFYGLLAAAVLALIVVVAAIAGYMWTQTQYYVKDSGGNVTVFQGIDTSVGPLSLHHAVQKTDIKTSDLPSYWQQRVKTGLDPASHASANKTVKTLRDEIAKCQNPTNQPSECTK